MNTPTPPAAIPPAVEILPPERDDGIRINASQRRALVAELEKLTSEQWQMPTERSHWTILELVTHIVAAGENQRQPWRMVGGALLGPLRRRGRADEDAMNESGVGRHRTAEPREVLADLREQSQRAVEPRWFRPIPLRDGKMPGYADGAYLSDAIYPRDIWLHRHDIARTVGTVPAPDPTDAEVVVQVVRDLGLAWAGPELVLELTGHEGGAWVLSPVLGSEVAATGAGQTVPDLRVVLPAAEFMRHLAGRTTGPDLFDGIPDAARQALEAARVVF
ncbi:maleylpyruvate isomerase N-terminal domain-containing protein [Corynebacterium halotolerans]|uniref:Mycothiol-dependent maleylpyruvate isomerase metal-binding domain-containing protein n=1 Tax=Corynebacterium halotolerans YIM 70093 = DSM 44683 TaxID=1121362 RepID=M1P3P8_9CORY|nr:maleylpyruvate isomerase N-terminal domain-containing protein [Corynebacterium halotolerans]AGF71306.1 hypothetical protein A605_01460 [Corynebacterium halotolerans YIM 70093 = DSM 44683]